MSHLFFGLVGVGAGLIGVFVWWDDFGLVLRGLIPIVLIVVGLLAIGSGLVSKTRRPERQAAP